MSNSKKMFEEKHPLEILVEKIKDELLPLYHKNLEIGTLVNNEEIFCLLRKSKVFGFLKFSEIIFLVKEYPLKDKRMITAFLVEDSVEPVLRRYREQYLKEHNEVSYFNLIKKSPYQINNFGFPA